MNINKIFCTILFLRLETRNVRIKVVQSSIFRSVYNGNDLSLCKFLGCTDIGSLHAEHFRVESFFNRDRKA